MKLATLRDGTPDGTLNVVSRDLRWGLAVPTIARTLQEAIDNWDSAAPLLEAVYEQLNTENIADALCFAEQVWESPLPRSWQWLDGSAFLSHSTLFRRIAGKTLPESYQQVPLMYQGGSDRFLGPGDPIPSRPQWGTDCEGEIAIVTACVAMGTDPIAAGDAVRLVMLANDVSLRELQGRERDTGFGWIQSKPASAFSPVAVTPDELQGRWHDFKLHGELTVEINDEVLGRPNSGKDMAFNFGQLISHAARTRNLCAGTIIGSGTVSNYDVATSGVACIAEKRLLEKLDGHTSFTPYLTPGDTVRIQMLDEFGHSIFGEINQCVISAPKESEEIEAVLQGVSHA